MDDSSGRLFLPLPTGFSPSKMSWTSFHVMVKIPFCDAWSKEPQHHHDKKSSADDHGDQVSSFHPFDINRWVFGFVKQLFLNPRVGQLTCFCLRFERKIKRIERFEVAIAYQGSQDVLPPSYDYEKAAKQDLTVAQWRDHRFMRLYPDCDVQILFADGREAHGATRLSTVRDSYLA